MTAITSDEKCSWNIKATKDAPAFKITTTEKLVKTDSVGYEIHYIEYSQTGTVFETGADTTSTSNFMKFDGGANNVATATLYDKTQFYQQDFPNVYVVLNPASAANV